MKIFAAVAITAAFCSAYFVPIILFKEAQNEGLEDHIKRSNKLLANYLTEKEYMNYAYELLTQTLADIEFKIFEKNHKL